MLNDPGRWIHWRLFGDRRFVSATGFCLEFLTVLGVLAWARRPLIDTSFEWAKKQSWAISAQDLLVRMIRAESRAQGWTRIPQCQVFGSAQIVKSSQFGVSPPILSMQMKSAPTFGILFKIEYLAGLIPPCKMKKNKMLIF